MTKGATARIYEGEDEGRRKWRRKRSPERGVCACPLSQPLSPIPLHNPFPPESHIHPAALGRRPGPFDEVWGCVCSG